VSDRETSNVFMCHYERLATFGVVVPSRLLGRNVFVIENCGYCDHLVRSSVNGFVVEPYNSIGFEYSMKELVDSGRQVQHLGALGLTKERSDFPSLAAAFHCISKMRRRLRGKENRVGSKRWRVALGVGIQAID
jgi:hypothetical protein